MSINDTENKRGRGRPAKDTVQLGLRLDQEIVDQIDKAISEQSDDLTRPEMIRRLLKEQLIAFGYIKP